MQGKVDFFYLAFYDEEDYLLYFSDFSSIDILGKVKSLATVCDFEFASDYISRVIKFELKIIEHDFVSLHEQMLIDLTSMQIDSPFNFQSNYSCVFHIFVYTDSLLILYFLMRDSA